MFMASSLSALSKALDALAGFPLAFKLMMYSTAPELAIRQISFSLNSFLSRSFSLNGSIWNCSGYWIFLSRISRSFLTLYNAECMLYVSSFLTGWMMFLKLEIASLLKCCRNTSDLMEFTMEEDIGRNFFLISPVRSLLSNILMESWFLADRFLEMAVPGRILGWVTTRNMIKYEAVDWAFVDKKKGSKFSCLMIVGQFEPNWLRDRIRALSHDPRTSAKIRWGCVRTYKITSFHFCETMMLDYIKALRELSNVRRIIGTQISLSIWKEPFYFCSCIF